MSNSEDTKLEYQDDHDKLIAIETTLRLVCQKLDKYTKQEADSKVRILELIATGKRDCDQCKLNLNERISGKVANKWFMWVIGGISTLTLSVMIYIGSMTINHSKELIKVNYSLVSILKDTKHIVHIEPCQDSQAIAN